MRAARSARARCSVCQLPVRGVLVWCQGCGHGGHADHMRKWFEKSLECPTGCGHVCLLRHTAPICLPVASSSTLPARANTECVS